MTIGSGLPFFANSVEFRIATLEGAVGSLPSQVASLTAAVNSLTSLVTSQSAQINSLATAVGSVTVKVGSIGLAHFATGTPTPGFGEFGDFYVDLAYGGFFKKVDPSSWAFGGQFQYDPTSVAI